jgi:HEAT repeat protein
MARLLECAADADAGVRRVAVQMLAARVSEPVVVDLLMDRATADAEAVVRDVAVRALADRVTEPVVMALLMDRAAVDAVSGVRRAAVEALAAQVSEPAVLALLIDRTTADGDPSVQRAAIEALADQAWEPAVMTCLLERAVDTASTNDARRRILLLLLSVSPNEDRVASALNSLIAVDPDWVRQATVRIDSCSREFRPERLPAISGSQGTLWGVI